MSSASEKPAPIHPQLQSPFFAVPTEIRDAIYRYLIPEHIHLFILSGSVQATECIQRDNDDDPDCLARGASKDDSVSSTDHGASLLSYYRHLCSPWATHWRCDEVVWKPYHGRIAGHGPFPSVLLATCRRLIHECWRYMADHVIVHMNEMDMVEAFVSAASSVDTGAETWLTSNWLGFMMWSTKELHIDLRLPFEDFEGLEKTHDQSDTTSKVFDPWLQLPSVLCRAVNLQRLRIWLDHDGKGSWSLVNERAMLAPITRLNEISNLDIEVNLPKLHPKFESTERHFTNGNPEPAFPLHRRFRQRYHIGNQGDWCMGASHEPDFPLLYELAGPEKGKYECGDMTMEELEICERSIWREGKHPYDEKPDDMRRRIEQLRLQLEQIDHPV
ncbi:hypothetical protein DE146DRAFT_629771 [Phaeosphaeria sp. MPI-PUGE-AT-0046c]|nr:hypothetical protein DE146DRAFT_629771 [Phaeosphaeria sp. MPI-PUGE-AT-0046c]